MRREVEIAIDSLYYPLCPNCGHPQKRCVLDELTGETLWGCVNKNCGRYSILMYAAPGFRILEPPQRRVVYVMVGDA
jgi:hypothetical protein